MIRPFKYHIYNIQEKVPLTVDDRALEFDTEVEAAEFLEELYNRGYADFVEESTIKYSQLYYDGGHINGKDIVFDEDNVPWIVEKIDL